MCHLLWAKDRLNQPPATQNTPMVEMTRGLTTLKSLVTCGMTKIMAIVMQELYKLASDRVMSRAAVRGFKN